MRFYLGTHRPSWLRQLDIPLFVSHRTLSGYKTLPEALGPWALDSGGFTELRMYGRWQTTPAEYVAAVRRYRDEIGRLEWAAPQDWMCEPFMLDKTGYDVFTHRLLTVANFLDLREMAPDLPIIPVLQGWENDDYLRCWEMYDAAGVDLLAEPLVGVGSVCRRQGTTEIEDLFRRLQPLQLHGFGVKTEGLGRYAYLLASADSLAWSYGARRSKPLVGCTHKSCANCQRFALRWRESILPKCDNQQLHLEVA